MARGIRGTSWLDKVPGAVRSKMDALIACDAASLAAIYAELNLVRFCQPRTWRHYAGVRRAAARARVARARLGRKQAADAAAATGGARP
jgi:hypothetical protein